MKHVVCGMRETIPDSVTDSGRKLIEDCWAQEPEKRPSFDEICARLRREIDLLLPDVDMNRIQEILNKVK